MPQFEEVKKIIESYHMHSLKTNSCLLTLLADKLDAINMSTDNVHIFSPI